MVFRVRCRLGAIRVLIGEIDRHGCNVRVHTSVSFLPPPIALTHLRRRRMYHGLLYYFSGACRLDCTSYFSMCHVSGPNSSAASRMITTRLLFESGVTRHTIEPRPKR